MSRIFTTKFRFSGQVYDAFITMVMRDGNASFAIKLTNPELYHLIPGGEIRYQGREGFRELEILQNESALSLVVVMSEAIEEHLTTVSVS